jgi:ABC-type transport system substrate-binding protein
MASTVTKSSFKLLPFLILVIINTSIITTACLGESTPLGPGNLAFSIDILALNQQEHAGIHKISEVLAENLPKIGIGINIIELTTKDRIAERTWNYPLIDYNYIPTYGEGGYDMVLREIRWDLNYDDFEGYFDSESIAPNGLNYYQYNNPKYDDYLNFFLNVSDPVTRVGYMLDIDAMLYLELPSIAICYPQIVFILKDTVSDINLELLTINQHRLENWEYSDNQTINYGFREQLSGTNIFKKNSVGDSFWTQAVYGSLYTRNKYEDWVPMIANSTIIISKHNGKMNVTVGIDQLAKFSDGSQVLSEDVKYSYELHLNSSLVSNQQINYAKCFQSIESISIIDNYTIQFNLNKIYFSPYKILSLGIVDKSRVEPLINTFGYAIFDELPGTYDVQYDLVTSCGPYMLDFLDLDHNLFNLSPNTYWNNLTFSNGIQPRLLSVNGTYVSSDHEGFVKLLFGVIDVIKLKDYITIDLPSYTNEFSKAPVTIELGVNMKHPIIGTGELTPVGTDEAAKFIRRAISHAIPREDIIQKILIGLGAPGVTPYPCSLLGFDDYLEHYAYDLDLARSYVEMAGYASLCIPPEETGLNLILLMMIVGLVTTEIICKKKKNNEKR